MKIKTWIKWHESALQGEQAVAYANKVAAGCGDTNDVGKLPETCKGKA